MKRVVVCGQAVVDFVFSLPAMPDKPEKYRADDVTIIGGGGGANAAVAIARLGGKADLVARLGDDPIGDMVLSGLGDEGVGCSLIRRFVDSRSAFSSVYLDSSGERQIVAFRGNGLKSDAGWLKDLPAAPLDAAMVDTRWPEGALQVLKTARKAGVPAVVDAEAPTDPVLVAAATHIAFSEQGLRHYSLGLDPETALRMIHEDHGAWVAVTLGAEGVLAFGAKGIERIPSYPVRVVDTLGAGDIWHGAFTLALAEGEKETEAARYANACAALKCTRVGGRAASPTRAEVSALMEETVG